MQITGLHNPAGLPAGPLLLQDAALPRLLEIWPRIQSLDREPGAVLYTDDDMDFLPVTDPRDLYDMPAPGVAVITARGVLLTRFGWLGCPDATGYDLLTAAFDAAFAAPDVRGIILHLDSPGGMATGCPELAARIEAGQAETGKVVGAVCDHHAYSAAYWLASACDWISVPPSGGVGSIGALSVAVSLADMLQHAGIAVHVTRSAPGKALGMVVEPIGERFKTEEQRAIDGLGGEFVAHVARRRGLAAEIVAGTEAGCFSGPPGTREARSLGLVDFISPGGAAIAAFARALKEDNRK